MSSRPPEAFAGSRALLRRAQALFPGGHHLSSRPLLGPDAAPLYLERGRGCRVWDVDGHEYVDYFMAFGPFLLGYADEEVDAAAIAQLRRGGLLSLSHPLHVEFLERLIAWFPGAEMGVFLKTGSEATTAALRIARRATGRRIVARCGYHGWHDWCLPLAAEVPGGLDAQVLEFAADPDSLGALLAEHRGEVAAVIVAPEMVRAPTPEVFAAFAALARAHGAVFVMDEVKTALRIAPGSMQRRYGVVPDLTTVSKALGNGWPIAAVVGARAVMEHAAGMHLSATYHGDTAAMAAAIATLTIVERDRVQDHVWRLGAALIAGLNAAASRHAISAEAHGEPLPPMPFLRFNYADPAVNTRVRDAFFAACVAGGVLLHPRHMWFISRAHTEADIDRTLAVVDQAMAAARAQL
jgi:glutamate-1-semialdehyde 2,1-aminomutase